MIMLHYYSLSPFLTPNHLSCYLSYFILLLFLSGQDLQLQHNSRSPYHAASLHEQRLIEMRQEAEMYRQQLELERLRQELFSLRGNPNKMVLPYIGSQQYQNQVSQPLYASKIMI